MSVSTLLGTPAAQGLFHRAIVQSGPPYTSTAEKAWARTEQVAAHLGVPVTRAALERVPAERPGPRRRQRSVRWWRPMTIRHC